MPAKKKSKKAASKKSSPRTARASKKKGAKGTARAVGLAPAGFLLVNMIPKSLSGETAQDSEPHLTVNPANPNQIVGTAFSPNPGGGSLAPIYFSLDGGNTWKLNAIVPSAMGSQIGTGDITTCFNRNASKLYGGILRACTGKLQVLLTSQPLMSAPITVLASRPK